MVADRFIVISLSKPLRFRGNSWNPIFRVLASNRLICRHFETVWTTEQLLAMQKVEGSNPFSRSRKGLHLRAFLVGAVG
jgi:hypothetical protein